jgi:hypothetical protein
MTNSDLPRGSRRHTVLPLVLFASWILVSAILIASSSLAACAESGGATITFSLDFPNSDPEHYSISVDSDGHAHYECSARISADSDDRENYQSDFTFSNATRARIFDLAAQAHYFSGRVDSGNRKLAFTGTKKLVYNDGQHSNSAEYNFSTVAPVQQLTALLQSVAATLDFGRRIAYAHRYQKLALDDEMKKMEDSAHRGELAELQAVKPILQQVYDDSSVLNVARARAMRLMAMSNTPPAGS